MPQTSPMSPQILLRLKNRCAASIVWGLLSVRRALMRLANAIVPAALPVYELTSGVAQTHVVAAFASLNIPALLREGVDTSSAMGGRLKFDEDALERFLRLASTMGLVRRTRQGRYRATRMTHALDSANTTSLAAFAQYMATPGNVAAWAQLPEVLATGEHAFAARDSTVWSHFAEHPREMQHFGAAMGDLARMDGPVVAKAYPFSRHNTVCDVGGGQGAFLSAILQRHTHLQGVLFDQAAVLDATCLHKEAKGRIELAPGNFFQAVPHGADAYILRQILHDWPDEACLTILRRCRAALHKDGRLLIVESCVGPQHKHYLGAAKDLTMGVLCGGRERDTSAIEQLLRGAGMHLVRTWATASPVVVWEAAA